jgi:hypothetical protein
LRHGEPEVTGDGLEEHPVSTWSRARRDVAIVLWPSFLAAAVMTMFFFAVFDPVDLGEGTALAELVANHNAGYALGFFFFWAFTTLSSALSLYLVRTESQLSRTDIGGPRS